MPLARYVPASARLFIAVRDVGDLRIALDRTHAWSLLEMLAGAPLPHRRGSELTAALIDLLGLERTVDPDDLLHCKVALFAPSGLQLGRAALLIELPDKAVFNRWYPKPQRRALGKMGPARFFQTGTGVAVCYHDRLVAVSKHWGRDSLLYQTLLLMAGRTDSALNRLEPFRKLTTYLPAGQVATVYLARDRTVPAAGIGSSFPLPEFDQAVIGLREGHGRIDVSIRANLTRPDSKPSLEAKAIDRLLRLPQTTLFATATRLGADHNDGTTGETPTVGTVSHYLQLLAALQRPDGNAPDDEARLGPHILFVAGQDLHVDEATPQIAIMAECANRRAVRDRAERFAERMIKLVRLLDPAKPSVPLTVETSAHLGATIRHIPLRAYAESSQLPLMRLLKNADPAWTVREGWLVVALSRRHLERILEAYAGLLPTLGSVEDVQPLRRSSVKRSVLSIIQADLVAETLDEWVAAQEEGKPSLLDPAWWHGGSGPTTAMTVPFGLKLENDAELAGVAFVADVVAGSAAAASMQPGDRILGVDGQLLSLTAPADDARGRIGASTAIQGPVLRRQRGKTIADTVLQRRRRDVLLAALRTKPAEAVRELASLGRSLRFASFAVNVSDARRYSARLSLRFADEAAATANMRRRSRTPHDE